MEKRLFILLFVTGVVPLVLSGPRKYYLVQQGRTWNDARTYCQTEHTDLAIIKNDDDMAQLQREAHWQLFTSSAWIGLYTDANSWHWSLGYEPLGDMKVWDVGEPNNYRGLQSCCVINPLGWWDLKCSRTFPFLCFDATKTGTDRYIYVPLTKTWHDAQAYCRQTYTDLASSRTQEENSILMGLISDSTWFGLYKDPWTWADQSNMSTVTWLDGQPDNSNWNEYCAFLHLGQVSDSVCSNVLPFFCYSDITGQQQILKMKIQSDQDLNDPAVNMAILEKIKQKLKEHGIDENVSVKWRVKPDGMVFHKEN